MNNIYNTPPGNPESSSDSVVGFVAGAILVIILVVLFLSYGLPAFWPRQTTPDPTIVPVSNTSNTTNNNSTTTIVLPGVPTGTLDVNY